MIETIRWQGTHDGHVVLTDRSETDGERQIVIDRPGDMVTTIQAHGFASEERMCAAAVYGVCLALRGLHRPLYVEQVLSKTITFMSGAGPQSLILYRMLERLRAFVAERSQLDGYELRDAFLCEAHRIEKASRSDA